MTKHFGVSHAQLCSAKRTKAVSHPRQVAMYLARKFTTMSCQEIADFFGGKNHTTVLFANKKISGLREKDPQTDALLRRLEQRLNA